MPGTHFKEPIYGNAQASGGLYRNMPIHVAGLPHTSVYFNDFSRVGDYVVTNDWTLTAPSSGSASITGATGVTKLTVLAPTNDQGVDSLQTVATTGVGASPELQSAVSVPVAFPLHRSGLSYADRSIVFETAIAVNGTGANQPRWATGLAITSTTYMAPTTGVLANVDSFSFVATGGASNVTFACQYGSIAGQTVVPFLSGAQSTITASTTRYTRFGIRINGINQAEWYVNGRLVARATLANVLTSTIVLRPSYALCAATTATNTMNIDYCLLAWDR